MHLADETQLIARFLRHPTPALPDGALGPGDDAAVLPWDARTDLVVTTDVVASGVHFFPTADPAAVGRFLVAVNLSDLAAMGAAPRGFLAAYAAPRDQGEVWLDELARGVAAALAEYGCPLLGGDTKEADSVVLAGTAFGAVPHGTAVQRRGASPGDLLVVTGPLGRPGALLDAVAEGTRTPEEASPGLLAVTPRLAAGGALRAAGVSAMVDLSDGLARAARLIADRSPCGVDLDVATLPCAEEVRERWPDAAPDDVSWRRVVVGTGGEYELLAAVPPARLDAVRKALDATGTACHVVGVMAGASGVRLRQGARGWDVGALGWRHFVTGS